MESSPHRIRRQHWQVRAGTPDEAFVWRRFLCEQGEALLSSLLDQAFDEVAPPGEVLHISRLFLEVKASSPDELATLLPGQLRRQLAAQLRTDGNVTPAMEAQAEIRRETSVAQSHQWMLMHYLRTGILPWQETPTASSDAERVAGLLRQTCCNELPQLIELLRHEQPDAAIFFRLLQILPESALDSAVSALLSALSPPALSERQLLTRFLGVMRRSALPRQRQLFLIAEILAMELAGSGGPADEPGHKVSDNDSSHCQALLGYLEDGEALSFLQALSATLPPGVGSILLRLGTLLSDPRIAGLAPPAGRSLLAAITAVALLRGGTSSDDETTAELLAVVRGAGEPLTSALLSAFMLPHAAEDTGIGAQCKLSAESGENAAGTETSHAAEAEGRHQSGSTSDGREPNDTESLGRDGKRGAAAHRTAYQRQTPAGHPQQEIGVPGRQEITGGCKPVPTAAPRQVTAQLPALFPLLVNQAGLVLLHPYIHRFLVRSDVVAQDDTSLQPTALPRAAALLHHLVSGGEQLYEFELGLIKVLLGLRPELPLPVAAGLLTDRDRQEARGLLQSVVGYWRALKNTSIDGLRSSFLQRSGLLSEVENGWQLRVERRPYDLLLDRFPWGFGIVKLPWMPRAIFTEW